MPRPMSELADEALAAQDDCNLSDVVDAWSRAITDLWDHAMAIGKGTDWVNEHAVNVLFASKASSLTRSESLDVFSSAYDQCQFFASLGHEQAPTP